MNKVTLRRSNKYGKKYILKSSSWYLEIKCFGGLNNNESGINDRKYIKLVYLYFMCVFVCDCMSSHIIIVSSNMTTTPP